MRPFAAIALTLLQLGAGPCASAQAGAPKGDSCTVDHVVDGDTFWCREGWKIRLIGIDSPERGQGDGYGLARDALKAILAVDKTVTLESDVTPEDRYHRRLAYVWDGENLVNQTMVRAGWALSYTVPPNVKYEKRFSAAAREAEAARAGLWATGGFNCAPSQFRQGRCPSNLVPANPPEPRLP